MLCENTNPRISSIQPDFKREGYLAAKAINRKPTNSLVFVGAKQVILRESTCPISSSGQLVQNAISFIKKNSAKRITVLDVAHHFHVSRALLDLRFRELQKKSVRQIIVEERIKEFARQLTTTQNSIEGIASDCNWKNINSLKRIFRQHMGVSIVQWRKTALNSIRRDSSPSRCVKIMCRA